MFSCKGHYLNGHDINPDRRISGATSKNSHPAESPAKEGQRYSSFQIVLLGRSNGPHRLGDRSLPSRAAPVDRTVAQRAITGLAQLARRLLVAGQPADATMPPSSTSVCPTTQAAAREER
jgi:hypothetical protein